MGFGNITVVSIRVKIYIMQHNFKYRSILKTILYNSLYKRFECYIYSKSEFYPLNQYFIASFFINLLKVSVLLRIMS